MPSFHAARVALSIASGAHPHAKSLIDRSEPMQWKDGDAVFSIVEIDGRLFEFCHLHTFGMMPERARISEIEGAKSANLPCVQAIEKRWNSKAV
jgi:hypothetical protein